MSRVHLSFVVKDENSAKIVFDVVSPDFSERGTEQEIIGGLVVAFNKEIFSYKPISRLQKVFCPPEYFVKYSGDINKVDEVCKEEGLMCTAWSYRVYKKAEEILSGKLSKN